MSWVLYSFTHTCINLFIIVEALCLAFILYIATGPLEYIVQILSVKYSRMCIIRVTMYQILVVYTVHCNIIVQY